MHDTIFAVSTLYKYKTHTRTMTLLTFSVKLCVSYMLILSLFLGLDTTIDIHPAHTTTPSHFSRHGRGPLAIASYSSYLLSYFSFSVHFAEASHTAGTQLSFSSSDLLNPVEDVIDTPSLKLTLNVSLNAENDFILLWVNNSQNIDLNIKHNGQTWPSRSSFLSLFVFLTPSTTGKSCTPTELEATGICTFQVELSTKPGAITSGFRLDGLIGQMLVFRTTVSAGLLKDSAKYYALEAVEDDLAILVKLTPDPRNVDMDLDLFLYRESAPFQPVFPNVYARNHHYNAEENVLIRESHLYWEPGLFIAKVIAEDSIFINNGYDIVAIDHCTSSPLRLLFCFCLHAYNEACVVLD